MNASERALQTARKKGFITSPELVAMAAISRQAAARHLRQLVFQGKLVKQGSTRRARYCLPSSKIAPSPAAKESFRKRYAIKGLREELVFEEIAQRLRMGRRLSQNAMGIIRYAFTEMLNNAIDHSKSRYVKVEVACEKGTVHFDVIDRGIGAFESLRKKFSLKDHYEAAEHLLKGKQTTDPARHSGQGIFFTSRIADDFCLKSARLKLEVDNRVPDIFLTDIPAFKGTAVSFWLKLKSRKNLKALFDEFSNGEFEFDRTIVKVKLSRAGLQHVSRSEAKRLMFGLDKFKRIILDFAGVETVGQAFADEIFRVFKAEHPGIRVDPLNACGSVHFMIQRALAG